VLLLGHTIESSIVDRVICQVEGLWPTSEPLSKAIFVFPIFPRSIGVNITKNINNVSIAEELNGVITIDVCRTIDSK
jgi:hypothetical protein